MWKDEWKRIIMHLDMDAFFASVEQLANPMLRGKPIAVCGHGRTVVATASYEARKYGVKTGMTLPEAKKLCPQIIPVIGNPTKYLDTSLRIQKLLFEFTPLVEVYSIDEAFLDFTGESTSGENIARRIKERVKNEIGITCSIGIAPNKLLAKLASEMNKPDGLTILKPGQTTGILEKTKVEDLCGIGEKTALALHKLGIETAKQLGDVSLSSLSRYFGYFGAWILKRMGKGQDPARVTRFDEVEQMKSIGHSHTFPRDTKDHVVITSYLRMLSERVGFRLRDANLEGKTVSLVIRYSDFKTFIRQHSIRPARRSPCLACRRVGAGGEFISDGYDIYFVGLKILKSFLPFPKPVRLLGLSVSNLRRNTEQQMLFREDKKKQDLTNTVDEINRKYGEFTVQPASVLVAEKFGLRCFP